MGKTRRAKGQSVSENVFEALNEFGSVIIKDQARFEKAVNGVIDQLEFPTDKDTKDFLDNIIRASKAFSNGIDAGNFILEDYGAKPIDVREEIYGALSGVIYNYFYGR